MNLTPVQLHPASYRHLSQGHPWVLKDQYTERFRAKDRFLVAADKKTGKRFTLINDTAHPKIKARLWCKDEEAHFEKTLEQRIQQAFEKRMGLAKERESIFLAFGEADFLPGLFILSFKDGLVIQAYARFWKKFQKSLSPLIKSSYAQVFKKEVSWIAWQERDDSKQSPVNPILGKMPQSLEVSEFNVKYLVKLNQGYDLGLYPDMAAIRNTLPFDWEKKKVLNLYAYTGAWSLYPLSKGASSVTSVDLSPKYIDWLEENLSHNEFSGDHTSLVMDVEKAIQKLIQEGESFDFILSDPPSFSSDGKKTQTSLKAYEKLLPLFQKLLKPKGEVLCFINTHSITRKKFEEKMKDYASVTKLRKKSSWGLKEDCPLIKNFPEGDYLKGILYKMP